jgi:hypothetical protein
MGQKMHLELREPERPVPGRFYDSNGYQPLLAKWVLTLKGKGARTKDE